MRHRCAEIHRVCRPELSADAHAAVTSVNSALWAQILLTEIFTGKYDYTILNPPTEFAIVDPATSIDRRRIKKRGRQHSMTDCMPCQLWFIPIILCLHKLQHSAISIVIIAISAPLISYWMGEIKKSESFAEVVIENKPAIFLHPLVLTDCCSLYRALLRLHAKTTNRRDRTTLV